LKPADRTKKIIFLAFLLSLLFHFGGIVYVAISSFLSPSYKAREDKQNERMENHQKINKQQNEWVETKARAGNFGTPVCLQDEFEPSTDKSVSDEQIIEKLEPSEITPQEKEQIKQEDKILESISEEKNTPAKIQPTSITTEHAIKPRAQKKIPQQNRQPSKPLSAPKPPLTLSQLTQGFLNHVKNEGTHAIHMLGKKSGTPSDEQIKYERYLQKLSWCLQNSFNIYNNRFPASAKMDDSAQILLSLNKDGTMRHCHVSKTSGSRDLDQFIVFIFNDASSSFPPVPQYLPHNPFTINYIIMVSASEENRWKLYRQ
jgi:outer membrane biosynthesis protein TonB